jgi:hypothetical protein
MQFVLSHQGFGTSPDELIAVINASEVVKVIERLGNQVIVSGTAADVRNLECQFRGWVSSPNRTVGIPNRQVRPKKK